jgi:hypothetical protein
MYWLPTCEQCQGCGDGSRVVCGWLCLAIHLQVAAQDAAASAAGASDAAAVDALVAVVKAVQELPAATANALQQEQQQKES